MTAKNVIYHFKKLKHPKLKIVHINEIKLNDNKNVKETKTYRNVRTKI